MSPPLVTKGETVPETQTQIHMKTQVYKGKHVIVRLHDMTLLLRDGTTTISTFPILSQGKPGSYYETIGGVHESDYKVPLHFSSIGHVYMPHSIHIFGNYFIHGIPYYPNGNRVSSAYSGGCIRLKNEDAKIVYNFIDTGTPILLTRDPDDYVTPTATSSETFRSPTITNLMVATISLEALTQDNEIIGLNGEATTRRKILASLLIDGNSSVSELYAKSVGVDTFVSLMNQKARALGLTNTHFKDITSPVETTYEDQEQFMNYISTYKSYLMTIGTEPDNRALNRTATLTN